MRRLKKLTSVLLAVSVLMSLTACGGKNNSSTSEGEPQRTFPNEVVTAIPKGEESQNDGTEVVAAEDGPRVYIGETTAKAGEYADVTVYVENAEKNWSFCGLHITYPDVLKPKMLELGDSNDGLVDYTKGEASEFASGINVTEWTVNMPEELTSKNLGCLFIAEMFTDNYGMDGAIVTFQLKIPDDAESGTVYPIGFYYMDTDAFMNKSGDKALQKYTFDNLREGSITVE